MVMVMDNMKRTTAEVRNKMYAKSRTFFYVHWLLSNLIMGIWNL